MYPISAPQGEDKTRHYLYRFWRRLPERGQIAIFDRSWYGRVLVERVEGFAREAEWKRSYKEINSFERQLRDFGTILAKFWIHISREEQLRRFEERKRIGYKAWKLTDEDWRNRGKWDAYEEAVEEMLLKTSTRTAPWTPDRGQRQVLGAGAGAGQAGGNSVGKAQLQAGRSLEAGKAVGPPAESAIGTGGLRNRAGTIELSAEYQPHAGDKRKYDDPAGGEAFEVGTVRAEEASALSAAPEVEQVEQQQLAAFLRGRGSGAGGGSFEPLKERIETRLRLRPRHQAHEY